jgi:hemerythrin-like metal-binding protein
MSYQIAIAEVSQTDEFFPWDEKLETGIKEIDIQHRYLVLLLNNAYRATESVPSVATITQILKDLLDYSNFHFETEETFMLEHHYSELEEHAKEHVKFRERITSLVNEWVNLGETHVLLAVIEFVRTWVQEHVSTVDAKLKYLADDTEDKNC